jgi:Leucine-rich repeat (LRR) protein
MYQPFDVDDHECTCCYDNLSSFEDSFVRVPFQIQNFEKDRACTRTPPIALHNMFFTNFLTTKNGIGGILINLSLRTRRALEERRRVHYYLPINKQEGKTDYKKQTMFIKKDLRKIPEILADAAKQGKENAGSRNDNSNQPPLLQDLQLQRRQAEFPGGSIAKTLCQPSNAPALFHLQSLSLYDCNIVDLTGIGLLSNLKSLSCGRNPNLTTIPGEFSELEQLQELCMDDCALGGGGGGQQQQQENSGGDGTAGGATSSCSFPEPLLKLQNLTELRLSNNKIESLPDNFGNRLHKLRILGLDHNRLSRLPDSMENLVHLTTLLLRHNQLTTLPQRFPGSSVSNSLKLLHISSNQLTTLPDCIVDCSSLTHVYANGNALVSIPLGIGELLYNLQHLNLAHNQLNNDDNGECRQRLADLYTLFGKPNADGNCVDKPGVKIMLRGNPALLVNKDKKKQKNNTKTASPTSATKMDDNNDNNDLLLDDDGDDKQVDVEDDDDDDDDHGNDDELSAAPITLDMDIL